MSSPDTADGSKKVVVTDRRTHVEGVSRGTESYDGPDAYVDAVEAVGGEVVFGEFETEAEIVEGVRDATVVVTFQAPVSRRVVEAMDRAELVLRSGVGVDHIDVQAATEHGIAVSNIPGAGRDAIASHAIALMLAAAHDVAHADREMRAAETGWGVRPPLNLMDDGTFGIVGFGRIGRAVVDKARSFGMEVIAYDPYLPEDVFEAFEVTSVDLDALLERADCVSVHAPHTAETEAMFSTPEFERMKPDAVLVNTARGPIVDGPELVEALEAGELYGAGLDVFPEEPPAGSPALTCDRIVCSPHHAGICREAEEEIYEKGTAEIVRVLEGRHARFVLNPSVYQFPGGRGLLNPRKGPYDYDDGA